MARFSYRNLKYPREGMTDLKAHCRGADWINKTIKKKRIRQGSVISLYSEVTTKYDPRAKRLGNY